MSKARPETAAGGRKLSDSHRAALAQRSRDAWARMTPEERADRLAKIGRKPRGAGDPDPVRERTSSSPPDDPPGGPPSPLAMTPRELWRALRGRRG